MKQPYVFISYARRDEEKTEQISEHLRDSGISTFIDKKLDVGVDWDKKIEKALKNSLAVLVIWTRSSVVSRWVRSEARFGLGRARLLPVLLEPCEIPVEFNGVQTANLSTWDLYNKSHPDWIILLKSISKLLAKPLTSIQNPEARIAFELAMKYRMGQGVPRNYSLARAWFQRAHILGHPNAVLELDKLKE